MAQTEPTPCRLGAEHEMAGRNFLSRFSAGIELVDELLHPVNERSMQRQSPRQTPNRVFSVAGGIVRYNFAGTVLGMTHTRMAVVAILLGPAAFERQGDTCVPRTELLRTVLGHDGLDCDDKTFYSIGLFSPFGWPTLWGGTSHVEHNAEFFLVSDESGPSGKFWRVSGPPSVRRRFFDPESPAERERRLVSALKGLPDLAVPGGSVSLDAFCQTHGFETADLRHVLTAPSIGFQVIDHRGRAVIQRSFN